VGRKHCLISLTRPKFDISLYEKNVRILKIGGAWRPVDARSAPTGAKRRQSPNPFYSEITTDTDFTKNQKQEKTDMAKRERKHELKVYLSDEEERILEAKPMR